MPECGPVEEIEKSKESVPKLTHPTHVVERIAGKRIVKDFGKKKREATA